MVPKIHQKRRSFRTTADYLLHDVAANTNERVAWTATRNLATKNPDLAWKVMAATSMDQNRLKSQAGVPNTGRKSKDHVLHFTLSWHPEEAAALNKGEMMRAANTILHVMGAERHQSLIVAHNDRPQPHVHVVVNRVDPRDGRILSSSFEKLKASRWAEAYEKARGKIYCHERVINNAARDRGEYTRGEKDVPRPVHELAEATNDNAQRQQLLDEHRKQVRLLKEIERRQAARHQSAWEKHEAGLRQQQTRITTASQQALAKRMASLRQTYRPQWVTLHHQQLIEQRQFDERETRLLGKVRNALSVIDFKTLLTRGNEGDERRLSTFRESFQLLADSGARQEALRSRQQRAEQELQRQQREQERLLREQVQAAEKKLLAASRQRADQQRSDLILTQAMERSKVRTQWHQQRQAFRERLEELRSAEVVAAKETPRPQTSPSDLLPVENREQAAHNIDSWKTLRDDPFAPRHGKDRDDDRDR